MALLWADNFDGISTSQELASKYDNFVGSHSYITINASGGRHGDACVQWSDGGQARFERHIRLASEDTLTTANGVYVGFDFYSSEPPVNLLLLLSCFNTTNSPTSTLGQNTRLYLNTSGGIDPYVWQDNGGQLPSYYINICDGQWHRLEYLFKVGNGTSGWFSFWVDGELAFGSLTGTDSANFGSTNPSITRFSFGPSDANMATTQDMRIGNIIIGDDTAGGGYTAAVGTRLGDARVEIIRPNGAGSNADMTASSGANYTCVDDIGNGDTDYVESGTSGHVDTYAFGNMTATPNQIFGVVAAFQARNNAAGTADIRAKAISGTTTSNGDTRTIGASYKFYTYGYGTDPDTATAWTSSGVNAAEFGFEVV